MIIVSKSKRELGKVGERLALSFLKKQGCRILKTNYRTCFGEIDIIVKDKDIHCFIEVKSRNSHRFGLPQEAVSVLKQRRMNKCALVYLKENNLLDKKARFDVISILDPLGKVPQINFIKNAFEAEAFSIY